MRNATCCLLVVMFGSWSSSLGQNAPKFTTPQIVATFQRLNQTGPISPATLFTPKHWGTFQVSLVMVQTVAGPVNGWWNAEFNWTDGGGAESYNPISLGDARGQDNWIFATRVKAGTPFIFSTTEADSPSGKYNVWIVVEQLM